MSDLRELYQEVILDHNRSPKNFRVPEGKARFADGYNPLCGDKVTIYVVLDGDVIRDVTFQGVGCAISTASASLMTERLKGRTIEEAKEIFSTFHEMVTGEPRTPVDSDTLVQVVREGQQLVALHPKFPGGRKVVDADMKAILYDQLEDRAAS